MAVITPGYAEIWTAFNTTGDNQTMFTSMGVAKSDTSPLTQAQADEILEIVADALGPMVSSAYAIGPGHIIDGITGGTNRLDGTWGSRVGDLSPSCLPQNCAYLFRKQTALGGRANRGRGYIPGIPEGDVSTVGIVSGTSLSAFITAMADYRNDLIAHARVSTPVVLHDDAMLTPTAITNLSAKTTIATQRRRLRP